MSGLTPEQGRSLLLEGRFSDLTLVCKEVRFKVHKNIVCVASPLIDRLCSARPEETYIQVPDPVITPVALARLLQQIYMGSHPVVDVPLLLKPGFALEAVKTASHDLDSLNAQAKNEAELYFSAKALEVDHVITRARATVSTLTSSVFERPTSLTGFADVLAYVFESDKSGHDVLREEITTLCLRKHNQCSKSAAIVAVFQEHESSLWKIAVPLLRDADARRQTPAVAVPLWPSSTTSTSSSAPKRSPFEFTPAQKSTLPPFVPTWAGTKTVPYVVTEEKEGNGRNRFHTISMMPAYQKFSLEELRLADYFAGRDAKAATKSFGSIFSFETPSTARPSSGPGLFSTSAMASNSGGLFSASSFGTSAPTSSSTSVPAGLPNLFSGAPRSLSSNFPPGGLFGNATSTKPGSGLFGSSNVTNTSGEPNNATFGTSTYVKPSIGLFGANNTARKEPLTRSKNPAPSSANQKPTPNAAAGTTDTANGSTGSRN